MKAQAAIEASPIGAAVNGEGVFAIRHNDYRAVLVQPSGTTTGPLIRAIPGDDWQPVGVIDEGQAEKVAELKADNAELIESVDDLTQKLHDRGWSSLMSLLDEHWPEDIFHTREDDESRDSGFRILSLIRWVDRLKKETASWQLDLEQAGKRIADRDGEIEDLTSRLADAEMQLAEWESGEKPCDRCNERGYYHVTSTEQVGAEFASRRVTCRECEGTGRLIAEHTDTTPRPEWFRPRHKTVRVRSIAKGDGWAVTPLRDGAVFVRWSAGYGSWLGTHSLTVIPHADNDPELAAAIEGEG